MEIQVQGIKIRRWSTEKTHLIKGVLSLDELLGIVSDVEHGSDSTDIFAKVCGVWHEINYRTIWDHESQYDCCSYGHADVFLDSCKPENYIGSIYVRET